MAEVIYGTCGRSVTFEAELVVELVCFCEARIAPKAEGVLRKFLANEGEELCSDFLPLKFWMYIESFDFASLVKDVGAYGGDNSVLLYGDPKEVVFVGRVLGQGGSGCDEVWEFLQAEHDALLLVLGEALRDDVLYGQGVIVDGVSYGDSVCHDVDRGRGLKRMERGFLDLRIFLSSSDDA